jgi:hypothetical protein
MMAGQQVDPERLLKLQDGQTLGRESMRPTGVYQATGSMSDHAISAPTI